MNQLPGGHREDEQQEIRDALDQAYQISNYLHCGVDKSTVGSMMSLAEQGVKPEHIAMIVSEIKKAASN